MGHEQLLLQLVFILVDNPLLKGFLVVICRKSCEEELIVVVFIVNARAESIEFLLVKEPVEGVRHLVVETIDSFFANCFLAPVRSALLWWQQLQLAAISELLKNVVTILQISTLVAQAVLL